MAAHDLAALGDATQVYSILILLSHPRQVQPLCDANLPFKLASIATVTARDLAALGDAPQVHSILFLLPHPRQPIQEQRLLVSLAVLQVVSQYTLPMQMKHNKRTAHLKVIQK